MPTHWRTVTESGRVSGWHGLSRTQPIRRRKVFGVRLHENRFPCVRCRQEHSTHSEGIADASSTSRTFERIPSSGGIHEASQPRLSFSPVSTRKKPHRPRRTVLDPSRVSGGRGNPIPVDPGGSMEQALGGHVITCGSSGVIGSMRSGGLIRCCLLWVLGSSATRRNT